MGFTKIVKDRAYFKRFQVKYRRRRQCKTDYHARRKMIFQDRNKYCTPKYRFVVRKTNKKIICQLACAMIKGDKIVCEATSSELPRYGIKFGLSNYAAAYCTGLLLARRYLNKLKIAKKFPGSTEVSKVGEDYNEQPTSEGHNPFKAILDIGIARTTTGNRIFGALKGAVDGGIYIPHKETRFPGYDKENGKFDPEVHRKRIFGIHVAENMKKMREEAPKEVFERQFGNLVKNSISSEMIEELYKKAHALIRQNPNRLDNPKKEYKFKTGKLAKKSLAERKNRIANIKKSFLEKKGRLDVFE